MGQDAHQPAAAVRRHFFISAATGDQPWAGWIGQQLEDAGYTVFVEAWDIRPGHHLALSLNDALTTSERVLLVCSSRTPQADLLQPQWASAFRGDPTGAGRRLIPVRVEDCSLIGLLADLVPLDLVDLTEVEARTRLLDGVGDGRALPSTTPYPGQHQPARASIPFPAPLPAIWHVPYPRNPFFTGREEDLRTLASLLHTGQSAAIAQAISGLGGIGKTQLALEYAYRHRADYAAVLWASAETAETLTTSYSAIATLLNLPEQGAQDQSLMIQAVKRWLQTHQGSLLILDNADDLALAQAFLPSSLAGHLLGTTRAHAPGRLAQRLELAKLNEDEGSR
ncbi:MAG TPA: TIR domain-containing protein, partial [Ktedonobacteraceae bacterium]|nr:TIR domain-containing protein [Ktedonobacteraceae bacterium]